MHFLRICYTLSCPETRWVLVTMLWALGLWWVQSYVLSIIMIILFTHLFPNSISPTAFHVSDLHFVSCFCFYSHLHFLFYFRSPNLTLMYARLLLPWHDSLRYLYVPNLMYVPQSEINIDCPSNSSSEPPKFEDSRRLMAQHISWSRVLAKHIEPQYC